MGAIYNGSITYSRYPENKIITPILYPTWRFPLPPLKFAKTYGANGIFFNPIAETDLALCADDLVPAGNWASRVGAYVATVTGTPETGIATPFYPSALYDGSNNRKSVSKFKTGPEYSYHLASGVENELLSTNAISYCVAIKTGDGTLVEPILSKYNAAGYNLLVQLDTLAGYYAVHLHVDYSITPIDLYIPATKNSFTVFGFTHDGATNTCYLYSLYTNSNTAGVGVIESGAATDLTIGYDLNATTFMGTAQVIELMRFTKVLTSNEMKYALRRWVGLKADTGQDCIEFTRDTAALIEVDKKYWSMDLAVPKINEFGHLLDHNAVSEIYDTFFSGPFMANWLLVIGIGGTGIFYDTANNFNDSSIGGNSYRIETDALGTYAKIIQQTNVVGIPATTSCCFGISWGSDSPDARTYYSILCDATGNYYNSNTKTWQATDPNNFFQHPTEDKSYDSILFISDAMNSTYTIQFGNGGDISNAGKKIWIYAVTMVQSELRVVPVFSESVTYGSTGVASPPWYLDTGAIDYSTGFILVGAYPSNSSEEKTQTVKQVLFGSQNDILNRNIAASATEFNDGVENVTVDFVFKEYAPQEFICAFSNPGKIAMTNSETGTFSESTMTVNLDPGAVGYFGVGGSPTSGFCHYGYIHHIFIK